MASIVIFDLDNTLSESRQPISTETAELLRALLEKRMVAVISGASFAQFGRQFVEPLAASADLLPNLFLLPTSGGELYVYKDGWKKLYSESLLKEQKDRVKSSLIKALGISEDKLNEFLEDRDSLMNFSGLGKDAPLSEKYVWDPDQKKRNELISKIAPELDGIELKIGGTTSINITKKGVDKAFGLRKLLEFLKLENKSAIFVGDALFEGGNDSAVKEVGIETIETKGPEDTKRIIRNLLGSPETLDVKSLVFRSYHPYEKLEKSPIAFVCAEYALDDDSGMYAGGLGVLAGDMVFEAADEGLPFIGLGLWYGGAKVEERKKKFSLLMDGLSPVMINIPCEQGLIRAHVRVKLFGRSTWLALLDTNISENSEGDRKILEHIYDPDFYTRLKQGIILGLGGMRLLEKLSINPSVYHLNEGHTAFAALELVVREAGKSATKDVAGAVKIVREKIAATKHTIFSEAGTRTHRDDFARLLGPYLSSVGISEDDIFALGTSSEVHDFSTTQFLINCAARQNGVSAIHVAFEKQVHPLSKLMPITNGVHKNRWQARELEKGTTGWLDKRLSDAKSLLRKRLVDFVNEKTGSTLSASTCTVVWARRFASYKRPELLFSDLKRLAELCSGPTPVQFIISGKAHPADLEAQKVVEYIRGLSENPDWKGKIAYLSDYAIPIAERLVKGADLWLNTPYRGKEACGTSGMKAALNGALQMSVSDGWIDEVDWKGVGWILPEENTGSAVYDLIQKEVAPLFYKLTPEGIPMEWLKRMRSTMLIVESRFTARRMLADYLEKAYNIHN